VMANGLLKRNAIMCVYLCGVVVDGKVGGGMIIYANG
jgi:hypothetical protein